MSPPDTNKAGFDESPGMPSAVLPTGYLLGEFRIERVLGRGGFGVVYLAFDMRLKRLVAVKEFMPQSLAQRLEDYSVVPVSERHRPVFEVGLRSFVREACSIAKFKHPSLVEVYRFWEALGTAYMVMPFYEGQTLKRRLASMTTPPSERWLREIMARVLEGLDIVHQQGWLHRDIAPDNILLLPGDRPVLLDFGSAKQDIGDATQALAGFLKPGYAPFEQYSDSPSLKQGPWTDLYALGALLYFAISRKVPIASVARVDNDALVCAARMGRGRYSAAFLQFIDHCLAVWPEQRPRNIAAALELLNRLDAQEKAGQLKNVKGPWPRMCMANPLSGGLRDFKHLLQRQRALPWLSGLAVLCVAGGGLAWWTASPGTGESVALEGPPSAGQPVHSAALPPYVAPVVVQPDKGEAWLPVPEAAGAQPFVTSAQFASPPNPEKALDYLVEERDPNIRVVVTPASESRKGSSSFTVKASEPGFLYVFAKGARTGRLELLWPSNDEALLQVEPGQVWKIDAAAHLAARGAEKLDIGVMVSRAARHLTGAGWRQQGGVLNRSFADMPAAAAVPWFGSALCAPVPGACDAGFGAVRFDWTYARPPARSPRPATASAPRWRHVAARKAECESLGYLLAMDGNALAQRRFSQLGCRR